VTLVVFAGLISNNLRFVCDNSIRERYLETPSSKGDWSLCLVAVVLRYWATGSLGLETHSGPELIISATQRKRALASIMATKPFCAWVKVRNAIYWQSIPL
jgi:hypothetical protein